MGKLSRAKIAEMATICDLLSDQTRVRVIDMLSQSRVPLSVRHIAESIDMSPSATSHMLGALFRGGVVENGRDGREKLYYIAKTPQGKKALKVVQVLS
ncbi:MAG: Bacterial regulatory protein arsR family [Candidatus Kaiserbacteria bacterium]|nr:Bacterial regulatory protein arsR family [Candidatus Kaiserbacteria bacterium]